MNQPPDNLDPAENNPVALEEPPPRTPRLPSRPVVKHSPAPARESESEEEDSFFVRHKGLLICGPLVVAAVVWFAFFRSPGSSEPVRKAPEARMVQVQLPPPPTPPPVPTPPPKVIPPPPNEKRIETAPVEKPKEVEVPKPAEKPPEGLGTNNKGPGPGMAGLGSSGNGLIGGTGSGAGGGGSMARWYAGQFQAKLNSALRDNPKTRKAKGSVKVSLWVNESGKVSRSEVRDATGDAEIEAVLKEQILTNLRASEPPPKGMKMPITYRVILSRDR